MTGCKKGPAGCWGVGPGEGSPHRGLPSHYIPIALTWRKGGRAIVLGKLVVLDGRLCLGTPYRWRVLPSALSLPDLALRLLLRLGVSDWLVRDDLRRLAWHIDLRRLLKAPLRGGERYIALADAEPILWRRWPYATKSVDLLEFALGEGRQLTLEGMG